jgi:predicted metalloendopeptidase
MPNTGIY